MKKWVGILMLLGLAIAGLGQTTGHLGRLIGWARILVWPQDVKAAGFFPQNSRALAVVQLPLLSVPQGEGLDEWAASRIEDLNKLSGVRFHLDLDMVMIGAEIQVVRGRFRWPELSENLRENGYQITNYGGRPVAVMKKGDDCLMLFDDYLVHGAFEAVKQAVDRAAAGSGMTQAHALLQTIDDLGWGHGVLAVALLQEQGTSVSEVLQGDGALRSVAGTLDTLPTSWDAAFRLDASTGSKAKALKTQIEEVRAWWIERLSQVEEPEGQLWAQALSRSQISLIGTHQVETKISVPTELLTRLIRQGEAAAKPFQKALSKDQAALEQLLRPFLSTAR